MQTLFKVSLPHVARSQVLSRLVHNLHDIHYARNYSRCDDDILSFVDDISNQQDE